MDGPEPSGDENEALLDFLYLCPHGMAEFGADGMLRMINPACARMLTPILPVVGQLDNFLDALAPFAPDLRMQLFTSTMKRGLVLDGVRIHVGLPPRIRSKRGETVPNPLVLSLTVLRLSPDRYMAVVADVSAQVMQERRLQEAEAWFAAMAEGAEGYAFFYLGADGRIADWNASAERLFGLGADEALGRRADGLLTALGSGSAPLPERLAFVRRDGWHLAEGWIPRGAGERFWGSSVVSVMRATEDGIGPAPEPEAYLVVVRDMTERREAAEELRRALCQDHLTGLLNRRRFFELGAEACTTALRTGRSLSVVMVDADRFKALNDCFGHAAGDLVLCALGSALREGAREGVDHVARLGGEEFAVLLPNLNIAAAVVVAERLRTAVASLSVPVLGPGGTPSEVLLTASFGVAELSPEATDLDGLLRVADEALYAAKAAGRNCVHARHTGNLTEQRLTV
ncbi:sensor domain-containing diguanylate cyclase [Belnapia moabensis]|uniref:sensor domain-containing diguanylate cyclase n=1 Tax=Belnapia moabensis TaxID=365533 RepID=UPI0005BD8D35|nr:sensor domain-containing diguanylate cyclase [Belnapia moabensis]